MLLLVVVYHTYGMVYLGIYIDCSVRRAMFAMVLELKDDINDYLTVYMSILINPVVLTIVEKKLLPCLDVFGYSAESGDQS